MPGAPEQLMLVTSMCTPEPRWACGAFAEVLSFTCSYLPGPNGALKTPAQPPQCKSSNSPCGDGAQLAPAPPPLPPQGHEDLLLGSAAPRRELETLGLQTLPFAVSFCSWVLQVS